MPTNGIPRKLFDYHAKGRREEEVARQRIERKNSSNAKIGIGQRASALQLIMMIYWKGCGKPLKILDLSSSWDLNPGTPESEAWLPNTGPWVDLTAISELEYIRGHILNCEFCRRKPACSWLLVVRTVDRSETGSIVRGSGRFAQSVSKPQPTALFCRSLR